MNYVTDFGLRLGTLSYMGYAALIFAHFQSGGIMRTVHSK
jgi:hypothetical protein